jgi:hypothetical protein
MTKINSFNYKNERWSEDIIKRNTKWVISKENMKWKYQMHNKNYVWLYKVFLFKRSNVFSQELQMKESVYFRDLLIKHKNAVLASDDKTKNYDQEKERFSILMNLTPYFGGFRWGKFLSDNRNVFNSVLVNKGKDNLREYYINLLGENFRNHSLYNLLNVNNKLGVGNKMKQMGLKQITDEKYSNIISRKMENRLSIPHYFFSNRYITRSNILPQIRNWPNTIYSFIKPTIVNIKYTDLITTEFLKVFFNPKLLKRKVIKGNSSEWKVFAGMSIVSLKLFNKFTNELIKFTSLRSQVNIKNVFNYSSNVLSLPWVKKELAWAKFFRKIFKSRRDKFDKGFTPKRAVIFSKKRNIWLSKPLFRHTASNVIIDLYLFNNKSYKLIKYHHMLKVRAIYKYMYSMYANYDQIIQNIISRPRIFYINIIDPKMHEYYSRVIRSYENALIHFSKSQFMYFLLDLLKWNLSNKFFAYILPIRTEPKFNSKGRALSFNSNIFNGQNNNIEELSNDYNKFDTSLSLIKNNNYKYDKFSYEYNEDINKGSSSSSFGIWVNDKSNNRIQKYIPLNWNTTSDNVNQHIFRSLGLKSKIYKYRSIYNNEKKNILINDYITLINNDVYKIEKKNIRNLSWWKNEYYLLKELGPRYNAKVMDKLRDKELERNALIPLKVEDYPRWSKELLLNSKVKKKVKAKPRKIKIFGKDKYSLSNYKWKLKKGKKWNTLSPKFWEDQVTKYNTFSKAQKADNDASQKWVYDSKTKLKVHISKFQADNSIFDKIKKKRKLNKKLKLKRKLGKYNSSSSNSNYKMITSQVNKDLNQSINKYKKKVFSYFNNIDVKTDAKNYQTTLPSLGSTPKNIIKNNFETNLSQFEMKDKNLPKISTKVTDTNMRDKLSQGPTVFKPGTTGSPDFNNYKGKPYDKNKSTVNNQGTTHQYTKFENENSTYKFDNNNNVGFKDNVNKKKKGLTEVSIEASKNKERRDSSNLNKEGITINKERAKSNNNIRGGTQNTKDKGPMNSQPIKKNNNSNNNNNLFSGWNIHDAINAHLKNPWEKNNKNNSAYRGSDSNKGPAGNKRKIHTLRLVSKVENKYVKPINNINNRIKKDKLIIKKSKSLKILLRMVGNGIRNGRINKSWLVNEINKLNISEINNNTILNINRELSRTEMIKDTLALGGNVSAQLSRADTQIKKDESSRLWNSRVDSYASSSRADESLNIWNLLNENWNLSKYDNLSESKGNGIKGILRQKMNYIKFVKNNYKNDKQAKYKKRNIMIKVQNILEKNKIDLNSVLDLKYKIKWDKFDKSVIRMILILILSSRKRVYNNNIETYLKMKRKDIGRGRPKFKNSIKSELTLNKTRGGHISRRNKKLNKKIGTEFKNYLHYSYERLVGIIRNKFINNDKLYIDIIKQEFYKINRDVIVSKTTENYNYESNILNNSYEFGYYTNNINTRFTMAWNEISQFSLKLWQTLNFNKREENLMHILSFSDKAFKPYYRYMIRLFILGEYRKFINRLGFKSIILHLNLPFHFGSGPKFTWIKDNSLKIFNFIAVKTLFNIFTYNYRSLYILKPKFYHINKFRLFKRKAKRLNFNTWLKSIRYLKMLRKAPNNYWLRYHKLIDIYYKRILSFAKWDTERKVLMPYVLYFEDLLYNIYGKLALVRIWPLKKYFLSIYILTERLMLLLDKNAHRKKRRKNLKHIFTQFILKFLNLMNKTKIDSIYETNLGSNSRWPAELITEVNKDLPLASNYNKLEYFSKKLDLPYHLNSYVLKYGQLDDFIGIPNFNYSSIAKDQYNKIRDSKVNMRKAGFDTRFKKGFMKYWTKPIINMFMDINHTQDIRGFLFKLAGKAKGVQRKFSIWYQRGSFLGARHYNKFTYRYITLSSTHIRNSVRPTMEHYQRSGTFPAGATNLKVWYSSLLSSDVMELIFYLLKKKIIYDALLNRNFFVHKNVESVVYYNKWTKENTKSLSNKLSSSKLKMKRWLNKYYKRNKKSRHLNFGIAVKNRSTRYLKGKRTNRMYRINFPFFVKKF